MLDIKLIRENTQYVKDALVRRGFGAATIDRLIEVDKQWRDLTAKIDEARSQQKKLGSQKKIIEAKILKEKIRRWSDELGVKSAMRDELLEEIPNLPDANVPLGKCDADNAVLREGGKKTDFKFMPEDYLTIAEGLDIIDIKRAAKVSGSRFGYLKGGAVLLELALIQFAFENLVKEGFIPVIPPVMIKPDVYQGMGRLAADQKDERYYLAKDDLYLIGSAEHTLGPLHKDEVFEEKQLPRRYVGFSTCFRKEAGSYGKDTRGILRVHQFDKVEMFVFSDPKNSNKELEKLVALQEKMVKALKLPYRILEICSGDLGWTDARQFDLEIWLPAQKQYRETHSASNTTDFQARGTNVRLRRKSGDLVFAHMLNATAFAIGRTIIAIIENYQTAKGAVRVPLVLQKYINLKEIEK